MSFDEFMKNLRSSNNMTLAETAKQLGISITAINYIEHGKTKLPSKKLLEQLSQFTKKTPIEIMGSILYPEIDVTIKNTNNLILKYCLLLFTDGWNINQIPYHYNSPLDLNYEYGARMINKVDQKNIIVISPCTQFLTTSDIKYKNEFLIEFIATIIKHFIPLLDEFRSVHVLFDNTNEQEKKLFNKLKLLKINKIGFDLKLISFDITKEEITDEITFK